MTRFSRLFFSCLLALNAALASVAQAQPAGKLVLGAERQPELLKLINKRPVALLVNQSSMVQGRHLVDTLLAQRVNIKRIYVPEHGFRGTADAGASVANETDAATGLPIISLYGKKKEPSADDLRGVAVVLVDLQDVGARFYTYINSLEYLMRACFKVGVEVIVLDRPNPNGDVIDGPILDTNTYRSFIGRMPVPVLHGLTMGEYAGLMRGQGWVPPCGLRVLPMLNYSHKTQFAPPQRPSPNLPNYTAIRLYPSLCFFEGTVVSVGRGTEFPFQVYGAPAKELGPFSFVPQPVTGAAEPPHKGVRCHGYDLRTEALNRGLTLQYLIDAYKQYPNKEAFFKEDFFNKLAGTNQLIKDIKAGKTEDQIRESWQPALEQYRAMRQKYLLYPD